MREAVAVRIRDAIADATARLTDAGCETPRLDAELLLASVLGGSRAALVTDADAQIGTAALERFDALVERRAAREPVAYILGQKEFRWIALSVDRRVLIPRPESELLVEVGLSLPFGVRVADVGTGSGAVALALKHERPDLQVIGVDLSADALEVARGNAARLGLEVEFVQADLLEGLTGPFDAVLANLPYVPDDTELPPEIALYEPRGAVYAGAEGLELVRQLLSMLPASVTVVALEVGFDQASEVARLVRRTGFRSVEVLSDLAGHDRVVAGRRP